MFAIECAKLQLLLLNLLFLIQFKVVTELLLSSQHCAKHCWVGVSIQKKKTPTKHKVFPFKEISQLKVIQDPGLDRSNVGWNRKRGVKDKSEVLA